MFLLSTVSIVLGVAAAHRVGTSPDRAALMETAGGLFLVLGLGLIGFCLPVFR